MKPITVVVGAAVLLASAGMVRVAWAAGCLNMVPCSDPAFPQEGLTCEPSGGRFKHRWLGRRTAFSLRAIPAAATFAT